MWFKILTRKHFRQMNAELDRLRNELTQARQAIGVVTVRLDEPIYPGRINEIRGVLHMYRDQYEERSSLTLPPSLRRNPDE